MSAGYRTVAEWAAAAHNGAIIYAMSRKVPSQASVAGRWVDLSMTSGNPPPNYYASTPLEAAVLDPFRGIFHGDDVMPAHKHLVEWTLATPTAGFRGKFQLLDYLLYYPFIDLDDLDEQVLDNTVTLPRYESGDGVMVMAVAVAPTVSGGSFTFDYVDSDDVARTSPTIFTDTTAVNIASLAASAPATVAGNGPFLPLHSASKGVKRITAYRNLVGSGGLVALVLVRPLASAVIRSGNVAEEVVFGGPGIMPPRIVDGAYLGIIVNCSASIAAGTLTTDFIFTWA